MNKRLSIVTLLAVLLAMACPALAEDVVVTNDEMLGVWKEEGNKDLTMLVLPGSYAPVIDASKAPELYVSATWQESVDRRIEYQMMLNRWKPEQNNLLSSLFGASIANAIKVIGGAGADDRNLNDIDAFEYSNGMIDTIWLMEDGEDEAIGFTSKDSGKIYALRDDENNEVLLYWMDDYDPHAAGVLLIHESVDVPSADALTVGMLRPVIDMADGAEAKAALAVARWAAENRCISMDGAALRDGIRAAIDALEPADAQAFRDNYDKISGMLLDAFGLNPETQSSPERRKPFEDAGLDDELGKLLGDLNQRSFDVLNTAIGAAQG